MEGKQLNLREKLNKIQVELKAPKGQYNSFGKYKYRSCEDILEGVKPLMDKYGVVLLIADDVIAVSDRIYIKAIVTLQDTESEQKITVSALAREAVNKKGMDEAQITGATSSYARKYALNGMFAIDDTKDADTHEPATGQQPKQQAGQQSTQMKQLSDAQVKRAYAIANKNGVTIEDVKKFIFKHFKKVNLKELSKKEYDFLINSLENAKK